VTGAEFTCPCCQAVARNGEDVWDGWCQVCHWWTGNSRMAWLHLTMSCPARPRKRRTPARMMRWVPSVVAFLAIGLCLTMGMHIAFPWGLLLAVGEGCWMALGVFVGAGWQRAAARRAS
jgi:hypothetical protein